MTVDRPPQMPPPNLSPPQASAVAGAAPDGHARVLRAEARIRSAGWFARRALIGMLLLGVFVVGSVALLNASIEPDPTDVSSAEE